MISGLGYYTRDVSDEWLKKLKTQARLKRPSTADRDQKNTILEEKSLMTNAMAIMRSDDRPATTSLKFLVEKKAASATFSKTSTIAENEEDFDAFMMSLTNTLQEQEKENQLMQRKIDRLASPAAPSTTAVADTTTSLHRPVECRRVGLNILSTWGDDSYVGLSGLEIVSSQGALALTVNNIEHAEPRDLSSLGFFNDPRIPENLFNGINELTDDRFMWLIPYTQGSNHFIQFDLQSKKDLVGVKLWNYNRGGESVLRGAREIVVELDGRPLGHWICRPGPGYDGISFEQMIYFDEISSPPSLPFLARNGREGSLGYVRYVTPSIKQDYEPPVQPAGLLWTLVIHENWNDEYFVGLDKIELVDSQGRIIDVEGCGGSITALPHSLRDLDGYSSDPRIPSQLLRKDLFNENGKVESWLVPLSRSMTASERKAAVLRTLKNQRISSSCTSHQRKSYESYMETMIHGEDDDAASLSRDNLLVIMFPYPVTLACMRFYNYSKTPERGVKELSIFVDGRLIYMGCLQQAVGTERKPQSFLFTNDNKIVRNEKDSVSFCGLIEQDVLYINERQVMVRSKEMYNRKPSVSAEGIHADVKNRYAASLLQSNISSGFCRPSTSFHR